MLGAGRSIRLAVTLVAALVVSGCVGGLGDTPPLDGAAVTSRAPVKGGDARFVFTRASGLPGSLSPSFSASLNKAAGEHQMKVVKDGDPSATYVVKPYLSAIGSHDGTTLIYVFDVHDANGRRINRVSGQISAGGANATGDPWAVVDDGVVGNAAEKGITTLAEWAHTGA